MVGILTLNCNLCYLLKNSLKIFAFGAMLLNSTMFAVPDERIPGDDKKSKARREDTTRYVINSELHTDHNEEELPDSLEIEFPSHDLYSSWDTEKAHPYNFSEAFREDSVVIRLVQLGESPFSMPYHGPLTSLFGWRKYRPHYGTDINLETGDLVVSCFDGMVRVARYFRGYGNCVIVRHPNGLETVYAHLSKMLVESGQKVTSGEVLGLGGNTGRSSGSHLHFEIRYLGQALDAQDVIDFENGKLLADEFVLRKTDVENKYDLRAMRARHRRDMGLSRGAYAASAMREGIYRVRRGDTLGAIAKRTSKSVSYLCKKNKIRPNTTLRIGQKIKL
jgi:murein DD-endopeptidase MepM/ murein hydrolase activator NlpD